MFNSEYHTWFKIHDCLKKAWKTILQGAWVLLVSLLLHKSVIGALKTGRVKVKKATLQFRSHLSAQPFDPMIVSKFEYAVGGRKYADWGAGQ